MYPSVQSQQAQAISLKTHILISCYFRIPEDTDLNGHAKCMFSKGNAYRRYGVPELVHIQHRSAFRDWGSKMQVVNRQNPGIDVERKPQP